MATKAAPKAAAKPAAKTALKVVKPEVAAVADGAAKVVAQLRVKDLIERVAAAGDHNKKDVRAIVEATLAELGKALEAGEQMNLPPFGKIRIANQKGDESGQILTLKVRRGGAEKPGKEALAADGEDS